MKHLCLMARTGRWMGLAGLLAWTGCGQPPAAPSESAQMEHSIPAGESSDREAFGSRGANEDRLASNLSLMTARQIAHLEPVPADPLMRGAEIDQTAREAP